MKKQGFILFLLITSLALSSCQVVLRAFYGMEKVKIKTTEEVMVAAEKFQLVGGVHAALTSSGFMKTFSDPEFSHMIRYEIYNKNGFQVVRDTAAYSACSSSKTNYLAELDNPEKSMIVEDHHIDTVIGRLASLDGSVLKFSTPLSEYDLTVFIYWASYAGRFNSPIVEWLAAIHQNKDLNVLIVFVSADQREWWEEPESEEVAAQ